MVGLISGVPTSAAPRLVLQISDLRDPPQTISYTRVHGQRGMKRGAAEKMRGPAAPRLVLKKFARADHHDILEKFLGYHGDLRVQIFLDPSAARQAHAFSPRRHASSPADRVECFSFLSFLLFFFSVSYFCLFFFTFIFLLEAVYFSFCLPLPVFLSKFCFHRFYKMNPLPSLFCFLFSFFLLSQPCEHNKSTVTMVLFDALNLRRCAVCCVMKFRSQSLCRIYL